MKSSALLIVDVQNLLIDSKPYNQKKLIENIKKLISLMRENNKEIVYVRHDSGEGSQLEKGTYNWGIYEGIAPLCDEVVIEKQYNSAFHKTNLKQYLDTKGIDTIILTGLQTEYCIDATCKSAFDLEYKIIIPEGCNSTYDNDYLSGEKLYEFYNNKIWKDRFAEIMSVKDLEQQIIKK